MEPIYEICADTIRAGQIPAAMGIEHTDRHGEGTAAFGVFATMFGPVNQIVRMSKYASFEEFAGSGRRRQLDTRLWDKTLSRERALLWAERATTEAASGYSLYELRSYDTLTGRVGELTRLLTENIAVREEYSPNLGIWTPITGPIERVVHLWAYRDLEHRAKTQVQSRQDPRWLRYLERARPLITTMSAVVMTPLSGSALA